MNLLDEPMILKTCWGGELGLHLPPTKCVPVKCLTSGFGAVILIRLAGWNLAPGPDAGGPSSILHDEGASTDSMGTLVVSMAMIAPLKGSRTSPEKLNPKKCECRDSYWSVSGSTENGVHDVIRSLQRAIEVLGEWHVEVLQLRSQTLIKVILALLGIVDGRLVSVVPEMAGGNESITACICQSA